MIVIEIPGREPLKINHVVLDYNGTAAVDGMLLKARAAENRVEVPFLFYCVFVQKSKHTLHIYEILTFPNSVLVMSYHFSPFPPLAHSVSTSHRWDAIIGADSPARPAEEGAPQ